MASTVDGDRLSLLRQARDALVVAMAHDGTCAGCGAPLDVAPPQLPAVVRELRAVLAEIDQIPGSGEVSDLDRLADGIVTDLDAERRRRAAR